MQSGKVTVTAMAKKNKDTGLTDQQLLFCKEYLKDLNATQSAIRAGYSEKTAQEQSSRLLSNVMVQSEIQRSFDKRANKIEVNADFVLGELLKLANSDLRKLFNDDGALKPQSEWPDDIAVAVSSVEIDEIWEGFGADRVVIGQNKKVKFWDKTKSLEMLGRHLKLFTDKIEVAGLDSLAADLQAAEHRLKKAEGNGS